MPIDNGVQNRYIIKNNKKLRYGYTTGSCAAAASKAATYGLLSGKSPEYVKLETPKGMTLHLEVLHVNHTLEEWCCGIQKDAGDDPDVTHGLWIYASVKKTKKTGVVLLGGLGVGHITQIGLEQPVGEAAINRVPREMITKAVLELCEEFQYHGGLEITISIPGGEEVAKKTFNPRLGIVGGLSILGTTGIVEPMSEAALIESIRIEMRMLKSQGKDYLLVTPGNYGQEYVKDHVSTKLPYSLKCSNYIGATIDMAVEMEFKGILFISHIGKFIKVSGGIMNTHSREADARAELLAAHGVWAGVSVQTAKDILHSLTTEEGLGILKENGKLSKTMERMTEQIDFYLQKRSYERLKIGAIIFSNVYGELGQTKDVGDLLDHILES